jgi:ParB-like chromosome segregation protein Spo0J
MNKKTCWVHCSFDDLVSTDSLKPNPRNPNTHDQAQIDLLAKIISGQGWRAPITVSTRSGLIVRGHCRLEAAKKLGIEKCPVDFQKYDSEESETADMIADNRIAELSTLDLPALYELLEELDTGAFDMDFTGFDQEELERVMTWTPDAEDDADDTPETEGSGSCPRVCPNCGHEL